MPEHETTTETGGAGSSVAGVWGELVGHRHYRYRGCAPVPADVADFPGQALGDPGLHIDAWHGADRGEGVPEPQRERIARERAAQAVCARCPVLAQCRAWATAEDEQGRLVEPVGIWGGMLALDRHRALIRRRSAAPAPVVDRLAEARTPQKQALLAALAREVDEELVAWRAGLDVRTANWQRSLLCGLLGLDKETATRGELLDAARRAGVLPKGVRVRPDGVWPVAAAPTADGVRQRRIAPGVPVQLTLPVVAWLARGRVLVAGVGSRAAPYRGSRGGGGAAGGQGAPARPVGGSSRPAGAPGPGPGRGGRGLRLVRTPTAEPLTLPFPVPVLPVVPDVVLEAA